MSSWYLSSTPSVLSMVSGSSATLSRKASARVQSIVSATPGSLNSSVSRRCCTKATISRSEEHTSELQSLMRISYAVFCLKKKKTETMKHTNKNTQHNRRIILRSTTTSYTYNTQEIH